MTTNPAVMADRLLRQHQHCVCPDKALECVPHGASEYGGGEPDVCLPHTHRATSVGRCSICGDVEPVHVHNGAERIEDYFTVGRGETDFQAAARWKQRALAATPAPEATTPQAPTADVLRELRTWVARCDPITVNAVTVIAAIDARLAAQPEPAPEGLDVAALIAWVLHQSCERGWRQIAERDPGRLLTLHLADAHDREAADLAAAYREATR